MINAAIVGTGNISHAHVQGLLTFPERCKIVALCDIYPEKAQAMKEKYHLDCEVFDDHQKMLSSGIRIDLVHVCTPPYVHCEIAVNSMNAGCNVLVEKPMATCLAECDKMLEAEKRNGVTMGCIAQNRFRNSIYKLKKTADSGLAGKICLAQVDSAWWRGHCYYDLWWRGTWEKEGGGPTLNHAVHHIDMLNWLEGRLPDTVMAMLTNVMHDNAEVEDLSLACLHYDDGSLAQITSSVVHHGEEQGVVLQCADARISAPWSVKAEITQQNGFPKPEGNQELIQKLEAFYQGLPDLPYEAHTGEIDNVLTALETGGRPMITGIDGRRTVEVITAIYMSGFGKKAVQLPIRETDEGYTFDEVLKNAIHFYEKTSSVENFADERITLGNYK
ncbi:MAG: Gfo/Idh/MocA family oxidoreductase [Oscillospiraceae bacterium]|jgi:predicted dehydrogenase|nr:Gfo/Idh/MocA family oxidoreductase [Oscillospiraceae bacterium]